MNKLNDYQEKILDIILNTKKEEWFATEHYLTKEICYYNDKNDLLITLGENEVFFEPWIELYLDKTAYKQRIKLIKNNLTIIDDLYVSFDGGREGALLPDINGCYYNEKIKNLAYFLQEIIEGYKHKGKEVVDKLIENIKLKN